MREILFKAKRIDNGEWVEGYYRADPDTDVHFICGCGYWGKLLLWMREGEGGRR